MHTAMTAAQGGLIVAAARTISIRTAPVVKLVNGIHSRPESLAPVDRSWSRPERATAGSVLRGSRSSSPAWCATPRLNWRPDRALVRRWWSQGEATQPSGRWRPAEVAGQRRGERRLPARGAVGRRRCAWVGMGRPAEPVRLAGGTVRASARSRVNASGWLASGAEDYHWSRSMTGRSRGSPWTGQTSEWCCSRSVAMRSFLTARWAVFSSTRPLRA
jgi:hypothetical protein